MLKYQKEKADYWKTSSKRDLDFAEKLFSDKEYSYSLFFLHLAIEKIFKGIFLVKTGQHPIPTHNLVYLAQKDGIKLTPDFELQLKEITKFNITARYDDYKLQFYKQATKEYTYLWFDIGKEIYLKFSRLL